LAVRRRLFELPWQLDTHHRQHVYLQQGYTNLYYHYFHLDKKELAIHEVQEQLQNAEACVITSNMTNTHNIIAEVNGNRDGWVRPRQEGAEGGIAEAAPA
jgi:hypothetical protein